MLKKSFLHISLSLVGFVLFSCSNNKNNNTSENDFEAVEVVKTVIPKQLQYEILAGEGVIPSNATLFLDCFGIPHLLIDSLVYRVEYAKDDTIHLPMSFYESVKPKEICCFTNGEVWFTEEGCLHRIEDNKKEILLKVASENIHVSSANDKGAYLTVYDERAKEYELLFINREEKQIDKLLKSPYPIVVIGTGDITIVAIDNTIYLLEGEEIIPVFRIQEPIKCLAIAPTGIFYATDNKVGYFNLEENIIFLERKARNILSSGNILYLLLENGALYKITNTDYINKLTTQ